MAGGGIGMKKALLYTAILSCAATALALWGSGLMQVPSTVKLENARVRVLEMVHQPGVPRERHVRATDQVIVFLDDCTYQRVDPVTGEKTVRRRKSGEVIWHNKGEEAPVLVNQGTRAYRTMVIELK